MSKQQSGWSWKIFDPNKIREGFIQWDLTPEGATHARYFRYLDGHEIYKLGDPSKVPFNGYLWTGTPPGTPSTGLNQPAPWANVPVGTGWTITPAAQTLTSVTPHGLHIGDNVRIGDITPGTNKNIAGKVTAVSPDGLTITVDTPTGQLTGFTPGAINVYHPTDHTGYYLYLENGVLYIRYWDPTVKNPDGTYGSYVTVLPKASITDQKVKIDNAFSETDPPDAGDPVPIYYIQPVTTTIEGTVADNRVISYSPLTNFSELRYNSNILLPTAGDFEGEYAFKNYAIGDPGFDTNVNHGKPYSVITLKRDLQQGDYIVIMY